MRIPALVAAAVLFAAPAFAQQINLGSVFECPKHGFSIRSPKDWSQVPVPPGEERLVATFQFPRDLWGKKANAQGFTTGYRPEMRVLVVVKANEPAAGAKPKSAEDARKEVAAALGGKYHNLPEYVEENLHGGHVLDKEEKLEVSGLTGKFYRFLPNGISMDHAVVGADLDLGDRVVIVYVEFLKDFLKDFEPGIRALIRSLRKSDKPPAASEAARSASAAGAKDRGGAETAEEHYKEVIASLPKGWRSQRTKRYLIVSDADASVVQNVAQFVERMRDYLEKEFPPSTRVQPIYPVVRLCKTSDEKWAYVSHGLIFNPESTEVVADADRNWGRAGDAFKDVASGLYRQYMYEQFEGLDLPMWLERGLSEYYGNVVFSSGALKIAPDTYESTETRKSIAKKDFMALRTLLALTDEELSKRAGSMNYYQPWSFVHFLKEGSSSYRTLISDYLGNLILAKHEHQAKAVGEPPDKEQSGKAQRAKAADWPGAAIQKRAFEMTFGSWQDEDWRRLEAAWIDYWD
ncbi:MAG: hypothetical protein U1E76_05780 [Planctomycetota bacterium]